MNTIPVIAAKGLSKYYGRFVAVEDITFEVDAGEVVGFVGLNGAGKSTTINMMLGFTRASRGTVQLFGQPVTTANSFQSHQKVSYATGDMHLFDDMTGRQYLQFTAKMHGVTLRTKRFEHLVERFEPQLDKKIKTLSRGNHQKIALIAAFMVKADLIILDEPSTGLDPLMQQRFLELIESVSAEGVTIFMSSHNLAEVSEVCSRVILIKDGALVKDISSGELDAAAGKLVQVVTRHPAQPPKGAEQVKVTGDRLRFVYQGDTLTLQSWISSLSGLKDVTITEHSPEGTFKELYAEDEVKRA